MAEKEPVRLLIAALGGEGGGVLAGLITEAAAASGLMVSRTSIPGVAQRTGATTYYIEMVEGVRGGPAPILSLNPAPGQVDILLATELLEAARMVQAGFVTPCPHAGGGSRSARLRHRREGRHGRWSGKRGAVARGSRSASPGARCWPIWLPPRPTAGASSTWSCWGCWQACARCP